MMIVVDRKVNPILISEQADIDSRSRYVGYATEAESGFPQFARHDVPTLRLVVARLLAKPQLRSQREEHSRLAALDAELRKVRLVELPGALHFVDRSRRHAGR